jgi:hypothetical protein
MNEDMNEIVVGDKLLRLPTPWRWHNEGSWRAVNDAICVVVSADLRGDDGLQICVYCEVPTHIPSVVIALVVLANESGFLNNAFGHLLRYVSDAPAVNPVPE